MQLKFSMLIFLVFLSLNLVAQNPVDSNKIHLEDVSIDFLFNYYEQEGIHSPVTGGLGTEKLNNIAPSIIVNIPLDTLRSISYSGGVDYYSSASSDNINNPYLQADHVSSASAADYRIYSSLGYKQKNKKKKTSYSGTLAMSFEFDVTSVSVGGGYAKTSKDENREFSVKGGYFYDKWKLIYPVEQRNASFAILDTDGRHSANLSLVQSWVMNKRMTASVNVDFVLQKGILSTPFHRVYFSDYNLDQFGNPLDNTASLVNSQVEMLPSTRFKLPIGLRYNYYIADFLRLKAYYRFYYDTWNVMGHTAQIELPMVLTKFLRVYPFYRYHNQSSAKYFAPFATHQANASFYTSDYDLSGFNSHRIGLGVGIDPLFGIFNFKNKSKTRTNVLKSIDLKYSHYRRSDGLKANLYSVAFSYLIKR
ncbi:MAG: hypothetical protein ACI8V8_000901 [Chitinophagales bacterium]|jgi:hypothetical protein